MADFVIVEWARRAEACGFSSLATIGRVAFPTYSEPVYDPVLLARDLASLDQLYGGRFVLGAAAGARRDDFEVKQPGWKRPTREWSAESMLNRRRRWNPSRDAA